MIKILPYHEAYEAGIKALFAIPVSGDLVLSLEREDNYFKGALIQTEVPKVFLCVDNEQVVGVFNVGERRSIVDGLVVYVPYFCDLRIHPNYQKGTLLLRIIKFVNEVCTDLDNMPALTVVFSDNYRMIDMINRRSKFDGSSIPFYHELATLNTYIFRLKRTKELKNSVLKFRQATKDDIHHMMQLQSQVEKFDFHPFYDFANIGADPYYEGLKFSDYYLAFKEDTLYGICGIWDMSDIKQTVVKSYSSRLKYIRPFYNFLLARFFNFPYLPSSGSRLKTIQLHSILIRDREPQIFRHLLNSIATIYCLPKDTSLLCTLDQRDRLSNVFSTVPNKITKEGRAYLVNRKKEIEPYLEGGYLCIDAARI